MKLDFVPRYGLSNEQTTWLLATWQHTLENDSSPSYMKIRKQTIKEVGPEFNVDGIPSDLLSVSNRGSSESILEITLLGVLHIDDGEQLINTANVLLNFIRNELLDNDITSFSLDDISNQLNLDAKYLKIVFRLINQGYGNYCSQSSTPKDRFGYDQFQIKSASSFDSYMHFQSFEKDLEMEFKRRSEASEQPKYPKKSKLLGRNTEFQGRISDSYIDPIRVHELRSIGNRKFDLSKLIKLCEELDSNYLNENYFSVAMLLKSIINHVPPIFGFQSFKEVVISYRSEHNVTSFRKSISNLQKSSRNIGDSVTHSLVRKSEVLPTRTQIDFKNDLDILLSEVVRILK